MMDINQEAFIFLTHSHHPEIIKEFKKIETACHGYGDAWFLFQGEPNNFDPGQTIQNFEFCTLFDLLTCGFAAAHPFIIPGNVHFPILWFSRKHPQYQHYWVIEYDCRFSGSWKTLFDAFKDQNVDLITAYIRRYSEEPDWSHWSLSHPSETIPLKQRLRCFHPLYRISKQALNFLEKAHIEGWIGHSELLIPTLLYHNNYSLLDFGGDGDFVPKGSQNKFYTAHLHDTKGMLDSGTLRFRPVHVKTGKLPDKIYHPIKTSETVERETATTSLQNDQPLLFNVVYNWPATALSRFTEVGKLTNGLLSTTGRKGYLFYGPYLYHPAGNWLLVLRGEFTNSEHAFLDITSVIKKRIFHSSELSMHDVKSKGSLVIPYSIESHMSNLEIRLHVSPRNNLTIRDYRIISSNERSTVAATNAGYFSSDSS